MRDLLARPVPQEQREGLRSRSRTSSLKVPHVSGIAGARLRGRTARALGAWNPYFLLTASPSHRFRCRCRCRDQMPMLAPLVHAGGRGQTLCVQPEPTFPTWRSNILLAMILLVPCQNPHGAILAPSFF